MLFLPQRLGTSASSLPSPDADAGAPVPDEALLVAIARGDRRSLAELYRRHGRRMLEAATRLMGGRSEGEDLTHDVFIDVWKRAGQFDPQRGRAYAWLLLRLRSMGLDRLRSARVRRESLTDDLSAQAGPLDEQTAFEVEKIVESLPPAQTQVVTLTFGYGLVAREIATLLSIPEGTVRSRLATALHTVRARSRL